MKVLVTDGHLKAALAAVRSLGRRGCEVHTIQPRPGRTLCSLSAFCHTSHVLPPYENADAFDAALMDLLAREGFDYLLPASDGALRRLSARREAILGVTRVDLPPRRAVDLVLTKTGLLEFAASIGVPTPQTVILSPGGRVDEVTRALRFPLVAKVGGSRGAYDRVRYVNDQAQLDRCLHEFGAGETIIFQEFIDGRGVGFFCLYDHGEPVAFHMHERIWEYPVTGGPSVFARTVRDPRIEQLATRLLGALQWNGLAMVEFKRPRVASDEPRLMEINPRLWGSLDLSIASGVDFPYLAAVPESRRRRPAVAVDNTAFLWLVPDAILCVLARPSRLLRLLQAAFSPRVKTNIASDDLRPVLHQVKEALYWIRRLGRQRRLAYPHGRPAVPNAFAFDLHVHSRFSYDSVSSVKRLLKAASRRRLAAIAITDHESIEGGTLARTLNRNPALTVIVGAEVKTEIGDIIGLFLERPIQSRTAVQVIREVKAQGGLVMLPHPFSYGIADYDPSILRELDLIELRNARNRKEHADRVMRYVEEYGITPVGNSDAHFPSEIGTTRNVALQRPPASRSADDLKRFIRSGQFAIVDRKTGFHGYPLSQSVKALKQRRYADTLFYLWWTVKSLVKGVLPDTSWARNGTRW